jgi:hypothetical protein
MSSLAIDVFRFKVKRIEREALRAKYLDIQNQIVGTSI